MKYTYSIIPKTIKRLIFKNSTITSTRRNLREVTTHLRYAEVKNFGESSGANIQLLESQPVGQKKRYRAIPRDEKPPVGILIRGRHMVVPRNG